MISTLLLYTLLAIAPDPVVLSEPLCIDSTGSRWRRPVHVDSLEHAIVTGQWSTPQAGEVLEHVDGSTLAWRVMGEEDGPRGPRGGYVLYTFDSDEAYPALLDVRGHSLGYVNGSPRAGDVYNRGSLRLPFMVREGQNELLFRAGRGPLEPTVHSAQSVGQDEMSQPNERVAFIGRQDRTLPDLVEGEPVDVLGAVLIYNVDPDMREGLVLEAIIGEDTTVSPMEALPPLSFLKAPFRMQSSVPATGDLLTVSLRLRDGDQVLDEEQIELKIKGPSDLHRRTFRSDIDGSVQYYAVRPAAWTGETLPGIALSLHGAAVEAQRQASCYRPREWVHVVAPTNRRPFGFDWEHWGRIDAMEVLEDASERYPNDPARRWLTGHSMGGHGTWQLGSTFPDQWSAIAPSAGWISFWTYGGPPRYARDGGVEEILHRAANPSDTLLMKENLDRLGIYILHGDADDNVPVEQARQMRRELADFHSDWAYYEKPGAGHWWGDQCMDWPPLFAFLQTHQLPDPATVDQIRFTTVDPGASAESDWVRIETQQVSLEPSRVDLRLDRSENALTGTTSNVGRLSLDPGVVSESTESIQINIDGSELVASRPEGRERLHMARTETGWTTTDTPPAKLKGPHRSGPFRDAFNNNVLLVYGTLGTPEETARLAARARLDSERWWYRGNGHLPFVPDTAFDPSMAMDRNIVLYGNADTHAHWSTLLPNSPIVMRRGEITIGNHAFQGDDLATVFIQPRPGSDIASIGVVAGSGVAGDRLTDQLPLFFAGVGWPDWMVLDASTLHRGTDGIVGTGFFAEDWSFEPSQSAFREVVAEPIP